MVPVTFEKIARSTSLDAANAFPVSEAARATHESFESHLQRAAATPTEQATQEPTEEDEPRRPLESRPSKPPQNNSSESEPVRQNADEVKRDDGDARITDDAETIKASERSAEQNDEDVEPDPASQGDVVTADADEFSVTIQEIELEASSESHDEPNRPVATKPTLEPVGSEENEPDTSLAQGPADQKAIGFGDDAPAASEVKPVSTQHAGPSKPETPSGPGSPAQTDEQVAAQESQEAVPVAETTIPDDKPPRTDTTPQRHGHRRGISLDQPTHETPDTAPKPVAVSTIETAVETSNEDRSQQRRQQQETDASQLTGNAAPAHETTTPSGPPSRFAQHLITRTEDSNGRGLNITNADQSRFVDRVARAVQATGERGGTLRLRLSPPELGSLTLEVKVQGGIVSARVEADTTAARSLLLENLPMLRERLAEHGMRVDQFDVDLTDRHAGGTPDGLQQNDQQHEERPRAKVISQAPEDTPETVTSETPTRNGNEQLNIIV